MRTPHSKVTEHFRLQYYLRQAPGEDCSGTDGVRHPNLISCYVQALERLYTTLKSPPFSWKKLPRASIDVRLEDTMNPRAMPHSKGSYIVLPSRYEEPNLQLVRQRAAINAVHEATHIFCFEARWPGTDPRRTAWRWMHEASAVFMEGYLYPDNPEANRFALDWVDQPHVPLDAPAPSPWRYPDAYHAGWFLRYLVRRFDPSIVGRLWNESHPGELPFQALHRLLRAQEKYEGMLDPGGTYSPFFNEYCFDTYHLNDFSLSGFAPDLYVRFRGRALKQWIPLAKGESRSFDRDPVANLACHYHRVDVETSTRQVIVRLEHDGRHPLSISAAAVDRERHRGRHETSGPQGGGHATVSLDVAGAGNISHIVVCVANPSIQSGLAPYKLEIQAL
jgi:hypothetical protein